jgi:C_GCAxxG_C_C family probable redox protein
MNDVEKAVSKFKQGHSCSQSVFSTYGPRFGISDKTALKISCPFGGGMARMGDTCGAVTGAFMVIGIKYGRVDPDDEASKENTYRIVNEFVETFKARNKSIICRDLTGYNISDTKEHDLAVEKGIFDTLCPKFVQDAAEILECLL